VTEKKGGEEYAWREISVLPEKRGKLGKKGRLFFDRKVEHASTIPGTETSLKDFHERGRGEKGEKDRGADLSPKKDQRSSRGEGKNFTINPLGRERASS